VNEPSPLASDDGLLKRPVFVSYATADRKQALAVCEALERRGARCWIASRDVLPGENYQEAIVRAIRNARAMVLVFSGAANNSDEIKKELSLASRHHVPVMALRIEDVEPSDAFAYELSTRQWIDAFEGWDKSLDTLVASIARMPGSSGGTASPETASRSRAVSGRGHRSGRRLSPQTVAAVLGIFVIAAIGAWLLLRQAPVTAHTMQVRLTGFQRLSSDLPGTLPDAMRDEIIAAFNDDGVVGVSTAAAPPPGTAPAYTLGATIRRDNDKIRVIAKLTNERSGTTLWSNSYIYDANEVSRVPRYIAVEAGSLVRCGLFGASTYPRPLPDPTMSDYLQVCQGTAMARDPAKALDFARKVVAAAPGFSWGWSSLELAAFESAIGKGTSAEAAALRNEGIVAADKAVRLDPSNSEALAFKSSLIDPGDLAGREALLQRALKARPLACGCEHYIYGTFLEEVGRNEDAISEYRRSTDVLALNADSQIALGAVLIEVGRPEQAKEHLDAFFDLTADPAARSQFTILLAPFTHDYRSGQKALNDPALGFPAQLKSALGAAFQALQSNDPQAKSAAAAGILALPATMARTTKILLLANLGANAAALKMVEDAVAANDSGDRSQLSTPQFAAARASPAFLGVARRVGLIKYWRASRTRPDFCAAPHAPAVCRMI
jgi:tetratricopeptide (TPR) repeat protein